METALLATMCMRLAGSLLDDMSTNILRRRGSSRSTFLKKEAKTVPSLTWPGNLLTASALSLVRLGAVPDKFCLSGQT